MPIAEVRPLPTDRHAGPLSWETDLPLFGPDSLRQWTIAMLATALLMVALLGTIFVAQGAWDALWGVAPMIAAVTAAFWLLGLVIMAVLFRGRMRVRYTLSDDSLLMETRDHVAKSANRAAMVLGFLTGRPGLAGAGMIARSREAEQIRFEGAFTARLTPRRHAIAIRNGWRTLMFVQCTPQTYDAVSARILANMRRHGTASRLKGGSPLPFYLVHGALILAAAAPLVALSEAYDIDLFAALVTLCFAEATLWLIPLFGWVVIAGLGYILAATLIDLAERHTSVFSPGETYSGFDFFGGEDVSLALLAGAGAAYLVRLSVRALQGRVTPLLMRDRADMEG
jgi:hypothetical protein